MRVEVNNDNFDYEVLKSDNVVVDFWAEWCGPCRVLEPRFEELSQEMNKIKFCKLNVDQNPELTAKYQVRSIPTILIFKNGEVKGRIIGALPKDTLKDKIEEALKT